MPFSLTLLKFREMATSREKIDSNTSTSNRTRTRIRVATAAAFSRETIAKVSRISSRGRTSNECLRAIIETREINEETSKEVQELEEGRKCPLYLAKTGEFKVRAQAATDRGAQTSIGRVVLVLKVVATL